jgi:hypothetical protein
MRLIEKIGAIIALVVILSAAALGTGYAMPLTNTAAAVTPNQAPLSLCTFSWVQSNDDGTVSSHNGYNPIDPGDNTGNDPKAALRHREQPAPELLLTPLPLLLPVQPAPSLLT